jgi:hypothetical protein
LLTAASTGSASLAAVIFITVNFEPVREFHVRQMDEMSLGWRPDRRSSAPAVLTLSAANRHGVCSPIQDYVDAAVAALQTPSKRMRQA